MQLGRVNANDVAVLFVQFLNLEYILPSLDTVVVEFVPYRSVVIRILKRGLTKR